jgi:hypothetical protein
MGLPGKERMRTKLFNKKYNYKPDITAHNETAFSKFQCMMTQDQFPQVEEYDDIER